MRKSILKFAIFFLSVFTLTMNVSAQDTSDTSFISFLDKFTGSAEFQYSRIKFPMKSPIYLLTEEGTEVEVPFTASEWPLLEKIDFHEGKMDTDEGVIFGEYTTKEDQKIIFESGLEESELDLVVTFEKVDGKWYVTDCYNGWYGSLLVDDFEATVYEVQQKNIDFEKKFP